MILPGFTGSLSVLVSVEPNTALSTIALDSANRLHLSPCSIVSVAIFVTYLCLFQPGADSTHPIFLLNARMPLGVPRLFLGLGFRSDVFEKLLGKNA